MRFVSTSLILLLSGSLVVGCTKSSDNGNGNTLTNTTAQGVLQSGGGSRSANGFTWTTEEVNALPGGSVSALGVAPSSTGVLAASKPAKEIRLIEGAASSSEVGFTSDVTSLAPLGSTVYAASADPAVAGAGDVYVRNNGAWSISLDGADREMVVASLGNTAFAFSSEVGKGVPTVYTRSAADTTWTELQAAFRVGCVPTAATAHNGLMYVGAGPETEEGPVCVFRGDTDGFQLLALPHQAGPGVRQRANALGSLQRGLGVAIGDYDATTGEVLSGRLIHFTTNNTWEVALELQGDAPTAVVAQDGTIYVGTEQGRLIYLDPRGRWLDEPNLPVNTGVLSLLAPDANTLVVGIRSASGARVHTRTTNGAPTIGGGGGGTGGGPSYLTTIKPLLQQSCSSCHSSLMTGYMLSSGLSDDQADYQATLAQVNTADAASSTLLTKGSATVTHSGGGPWGTTSAAYQAVLDWINAGAAYESTGGTGTTAPVATVPADPKYVAHIKPILQTCVGCHSTIGNMPLSAGLVDDTADYTSVINYIDRLTPANSSFLREATQQDPGHPIKVFNVGSVQYDTVIEWARDQAPFN